MADIDVTFPFDGYTLTVEDYDEFLKITLLYSATGGNRIPYMTQLIPVSAWNDVQLRRMIVEDLKSALDERLARNA